MVAATVVAPWPPRAMTDGRSRTLTFTTDGSLASSSRSDGRQPDPGHAAEHRDRGGHRAVLADDALDLGRHRDVLRVGHAVADDRALQGHHRSPGRHRLGHLVGQLEGGTGPSSAQVGYDGVRAGHGERGRVVAVRRRVSRARHPSRSEWQNAASIASPAPVTSTGTTAGAPSRTSPSGVLSSEPAGAAAHPHHLDPARVQVCDRAERRELVLVRRDREDGPVPAQQRGYPSRLGHAHRVDDHPDAECQHRVDGGRGHVAVDHDERRGTEQVVVEHLGHHGVGRPPCRRRRPPARRRRRAPRRSARSGHRAAPRATSTPAAAVSSTSQSPSGRTR